MAKFNPLTGQFDIFLKADEGEVIAPPTIYSVNGDTTSPATSTEVAPEIIVSDVFAGDTVKVFIGETEIVSGVATTSAITLTPSALDVGSIVLTATTQPERASAPSLPSASFTYNCLPEAPTITSVNGELVSPATGNNADPEMVITTIEVGDVITVYDGATQIAQETAADNSISIFLAGLSEAQHSLTATVTRNSIESAASTAFLYTYAAAPIYTTDDYTTGAYGWSGTYSEGNGITGVSNTYDWTTTEITGTSGYFEAIWTITNLASFGGGTLLTLGRGVDANDFWTNDSLTVYFEGGGSPIGKFNINGTNGTTKNITLTGNDEIKLICDGDTASWYLNGDLKDTVSAGGYRTTGFIGYHLDNAGSGSYVKQVQYRTTP